LNRALCSDHFKFHYTDSDATHRVTRAYVEQMAALLEEGWRALFDTEGYRNPRDLMLEGRYATFERFERVPVLILAVPDGANHGKTTPAIYLKTDLTSTSQSPIHELFHVMHYGYTYYRASWFLEGVARWSQRFKSSVDACCVCDGHVGPRVLRRGSVSELPGAEIQISRRPGRLRCHQGHAGGNGGPPG
jgi:hypothetical protein